MTNERTDFLQDPADRYQAANTASTNKSDPLRQCGNDFHVLGYRKDACGKTKGGRLGAAVIPRLSKDIRNELPEIKGFSERNIGYMIRFAREYGTSILQQAVAKLPEETLLAGIPWGHHCLLIEKIKDVPVRFMEMSRNQGAGDE